MSRGLEPPPRPSMPLSMLVLADVLVVEHVTLATGAVVPAVAYALTALACAAVVMARFSASRPVVPAIVCISAAGWVALGIGLAHLSLMDQFVDSMRTSSVALWDLEVVSDPKVTEYGFRCRAHASREGCVAGDVWLLLGTEAERGDAIRCVGRYSENPDDAWGHSSRAQGVWGSVTAVRLLSKSAPDGLGGLVRATRDAARAAICPEANEGRALLAGCLLGDRRWLDDLGLDKVCATAGVSHLVAVSGSHMAIMGAIMSIPMERMRMGPRRRVVTLALGTGAFVLMCGCPPSAVRAWAMSMCAQGSMLAGRRQSALSAVSLVATSMALVNPGLSGQLAFMLSVVCVASLALFGGYASYALRVLLPAPRPPRGTSPELRIAMLSRHDEVLRALAATLVAQVASLPLVCPVFRRVSLVAPISNVLVGPPLSLAMALGALASCACPVPWLSSALMAACDVVLTGALLMLHSLARLPMASVAMSVDDVSCATCLVLAAVALWVAWPRLDRRRLGLACGTSCLVALVTLLGWRLLSPARIVVLDVGQGDAILVQDGRSAVLVDAGPDASIVDALARQHVLHLDAVLLSHLHDDHYGGIEELAGVVGCDLVVVANGSAAHLPDELTEAVDALCGKPVVEVGYGDVIEVGGFDLAVVWPREPVTGTENAHSLELSVTYGEGGRVLSGLLTGDAERDETGAVIDRGDVGDVDFLKVGHHGSDVSITYQQACELDPEVSVASAGWGNSYGHPREECVEALEDAGSLFLCTMDVGDVDVRPGVEGPEVRCSRGKPS